MQPVKITVTGHKVVAYQIRLVITAIFAVIMKADRSTHLLLLRAPCSSIFSATLSQQRSSVCRRFVSYWPWFCRFIQWLKFHQCTRTLINHHHGLIWRRSHIWPWGVLSSPSPDAIPKKRQAKVAE